MYLTKIDLGLIQIMKWFLHSKTIFIIKNRLWGEEMISWYLAEIHLTAVAQYSVQF